MSRRLERVNALLRQEISRAISAELADPRLSPLYTVTRVQCSADLSRAKVYVSVLDDRNSDTIAALRSSSGVIRKSLRALNLKKIPQLAFHLDDSVQQGDEVLRLLDQVSAPESAGR
jgi:ribosome-binding factor A